VLPYHYFRFHLSSVRFRFWHFSTFHLLISTEQIISSSSVAPLSKKDKCLPGCSPSSISILRYLSPTDNSHLSYVILYIIFLSSLWPLLRSFEQVIYPCCICELSGWNSRYDLIVLIHFSLHVPKTKVQKYCRCILKCFYNMVQVLNLPVSAVTLLRLE
jgi:hypothetical protein